MTAENKNFFKVSQQGAKVGKIRPKPNNNNTNELDRNTPKENKFSSL